MPGTHGSPQVRRALDFSEVEDKRRVEYLEWLTKAQAGEIQANLRYIATLKEKVERLEDDGGRHRIWGEDRIRFLETELMQVRDIFAQVVTDRDDLVKQVQILCTEIDRYVMVESTMDRLREVRDQAREVL